MVYGEVETRMLSTYKELSCHGVCTNFDADCNYRAISCDWTSRWKKIRYHNNVLWKALQRCVCLSVQNAQLCIQSREVLSTLYMFVAPNSLKKLVLGWKR